MNLKHTYTNDSFPTNTGSLVRPARFNLRLTCPARARLHAVMQALRKEYAMPPSASYADVMEQVGLLIFEHHVRALRNGSADIRAYTRAQARPLPKEDHLRAVYERLRAKFEK